ncbi:hypothetical protein HispidOSU_023992 [Sigmodon hispidus]
MEGLSSIFGGSWEGVKCKPGRMMSHGKKWVQVPPESFFDGNTGLRSWSCAPSVMRFVLTPPS